MYNLNFKNFNAQDFVEDILKATNIDCSNEKQTLLLKQSILVAVMSRVTSTILNLMDDEDINAYQKLLELNPGLDEAEALLVIAPRVKGLDEALKAQLQALFDEITLRASDIDLFLSNK